MNDNMTTRTAQIC